MELNELIGLVLVEKRGERAERVRRAQKTPNQISQLLAEVDQECADLEAFKTELPKLSESARRGLELYSRDIERILDRLGL